MDLCYGHPGKIEIVHNERNCPLCEALENVFDLQRKLDDANDEIKELNDQL